MVFRTSIFQFFVAMGLLFFSGCDMAGPQFGSSKAPTAKPVSRSASNRTGLQQPSQGGPSPAVRQSCQRDLDAHEDFRFVFDVQSIDGESLRHQDFAGRVLVVDLWATWCPPCRQEVPHFVDLQRRYGDSGLSIIGLNYERALTDRGAEQTIRNFLNQQPVNYPLALGTPELKVQVPDFRGYPTTLFIDGSGMVRATVVGSRPLEYLESMVQILLADMGVEVEPQRNSFVGTSATPDFDAAVGETEPLPSPQGTSEIQANPFFN